MVSINTAVKINAVVVKDLPGHKDHKAQPENVDQLVHEV